MTSNNLLSYFPQRTVITLGLSSLLITAFVFISNSYITALISILFILFCVFNDLKNCYYSVLYILPANESLNILGGTSVSIIIISACLLKFTLSKRGNVAISKKLLIASISLLICSFIPLFWGMTDQLVVSIKALLYFFFVKTVLDYYSKYESFETLYDFSFFLIGLGILFTGVLSVLHSGLSTLIDHRWGFLPNTTINAQAILCAITIINLLYGLIIHRFNCAKYKWVLILFCAIFGLLTQSRTFLLSISSGVFLLFIFNKSVQKSITLSITSVFIIIASYLLYHYNSSFSHLIDSVMLRFTSVDDLSNGRYDLWNNTITNMVSNKRFLWFGAGNYINVGALNGNDIEAAHNCFLEMWVVYGIIGLICLLVFMFFYLKTCLFKYISSLKAVRFVPLITLLSALFFSHHFIGRANTIVFILSLLPFVIESDNKIRYLNRGNIHYDLQQ